MILLLFLLTISKTIQICKTPPVFHGFGNCDEGIESYFDIGCPNEGSCKQISIFKPVSGSYTDLTYNKMYVENGQSSDGSCVTPIATVEILMDTPPEHPEGEEQPIIPYRFIVDNLPFNFYHDRVIVSDESINPVQMCNECIQTNKTLYHVFALIDKKSDGTVSIDIYVNGKKVFEVSNLVHDQRIFSLTNGRFYHYALYDQRLDEETIYRFTEIGINRTTTETYCYDEETETSGRLQFDKLLTQNYRMWWWFLGVFLFMLAMIFLAIVITICVYLIRSANGKKSKVI